MILHQTLYGIVEDGSEGVFLGFDGLRELVCEVFFWKKSPECLAFSYILVIFVAVFVNYI
jgi:hypothetical protein